MQDQAAALVIGVDNEGLNYATSFRLAVDQRMVGVELIGILPVDAVSDAR